MTKKRLICFLLTLTLVLPLVVSCGGKGSGGASTSTEAQTTGEPEKLVINTWTSHSFDKQIVNYIPDIEFTNDYTVYMTRGETEGCQITLRSEKSYRKLSFVYKSGDAETIPYKIFSEDRSHEIRRKQYPDATIPYNEGNTFNLKSDASLTYLFEFTTTQETAAGDYVFEFELRQGETVVHTYKITVHVWDIEMPVDKTYVSGIQIYRYCIAMYSGYCDDEKYKEYYDFLLEHNISAYKLPYDILDPRADAYMSDPRVTSFNVMQYDELDKISDAKLKEYYDKIKSNPEWLAKAYFYPYDEPRDTVGSTVFDLEKVCERLRRVCPKIRITAPFYMVLSADQLRSISSRFYDGSYTGTMDQFDHMAQYIDLWCPKLCMFDDVMAYKDYVGSTTPRPFAERIAEQQAEGDGLWVYVCNEPPQPYANIWVNDEGLVSRLLFWQQYQHGAEGFLYWGSNMWSETVGGPFQSMITLPPQARYGEGCFLYPGELVGLIGPVGSLRLKYIRDGIDDIELFYLAERYLGERYVMDMINTATPTLTTYNIDSDEFVAMKKKLCEDLIAAMASSK